MSERDDAEWGVIPAHVFTEAEVNGEASYDVPGWGRVTITPQGQSPFSREDIEEAAAANIPPVFDFATNDDGTITATPRLGGPS